MARVPPRLSEGADWSTELLDLAILRMSTSYRSPSPLARRLAERVRQIRARLGLSRGEIAVCLGVPYSIVPDIEAGRRALSASEVVKLAACFGESLESVLGVTRSNAQNDEQTFNADLLKPGVSERDPDQAIEAFRAEQISAGKLAELLEIDVGDVDPQTWHYRTGGWTDERPPRCLVDVTVLADAVRCGFLDHLCRTHRVAVGVLTLEQARSARRRSPEDRCLQETASVEGAARSPARCTWLDAVVPLLAQGRVEMLGASAVELAEVVRWVGSSAMSVWELELLALGLAGKGLVLTADLVVWRAMEELGIDEPGIANVYERGPVGIGSHDEVTMSGLASQ